MVKQFMQRKRKAVMTTAITLTNIPQNVKKAFIMVVLPVRL
jgi:hypothetical protein